MSWSSCPRVGCYSPACAAAPTDRNSASDRTAFFGRSRKKWGLWPRLKHSGSYHPFTEQIIAHCARTRQIDKLDWGLSEPVQNNTAAPYSQHCCGPIRNSYNDPRSPQGHIVQCVQKNIYFRQINKWIAELNKMLEWCYERQVIFERTCSYHRNILENIGEVQQAARLSTSRWVLVRGLSTWGFTKHWSS